MKMAIAERIEKYLQEKDENGKLKGNFVPEIRYFDGTGSYSTRFGEYNSKTLVGSLELFLKSKGY